MLPSKIGLRQEIILVNFNAVYVEKRSLRKYKVNFKINEKNYFANNLQQ